MIMKDHSDETAKKTTKRVKKEFEEGQTSPENYKTVSINFAALNATHTQEQSPAYALLKKIAATELDLGETKQRNEGDISVS